MQYGFVLPYGDARAAAECAELAEKHGWDGFFVWEPVWGIDAWVCLTAAAMCTRTIRLGTLLTPPSRLRPWQLAAAAATLDNLSGGRVVLSVGLGAADTGFAEFGEVTDMRERAELLDESLAIMTGLWRGQPFCFTGKHHQVQPCDFLPPPAPVQQPGVPLWVVGLLSSKKSMRRALAYDGLLPSVRDAQGNHREMLPADIESLAEQIQARPADAGPFDVIVEGTTDGNKPQQGRKQVARWQDAGATWWIEAMWMAERQIDVNPAVRERIRAGPPR